MSLDNNEVEHSDNRNVPTSDVFNYKGLTFIISKGRSIAIDVDVANTDETALKQEEALERFYNFCFRKRASEAVALRRALDILSSFRLSPAAIDYLIKTNRAANGGCHVILGGTGAGKSHLIDNQLVNLENSKLFVISEPAANTLTLSVGLEAVIQELIFGDASTLIIDSLRGIVYSGQGATLSGGVSAELVNSLVDFSRLGALFGKSIFAVVNPLTPDVSKQELLQEAISGSTTGLTLLSREDFDSAKVSDRRFGDRQYVTIPRSSFTSKVVKLTKSTVQPETSVAEPRTLEVASNHIREDRVDGPHVTQQLARSLAQSFNLATLQGTHNEN